MKIESVMRAFKNCGDIFICPICKRRTAVFETPNFKCADGHCYDLAAAGYVNFLPGQKATKYSRDLFLSRQKILRAGYYDRVYSEIEDVIRACAKGNGKLNILDAGCGEGWYAAKVSEIDGAFVFGMDNSKEAVVLAAKAAKNAVFMVGDLANIPLGASSVDVVLNILTPANYAEFGRVLKTGGLLLKVIPGAGYLKEIRGAAKKDEAYSNESVRRHFEKNVDMIEERQIKYSMPVEEADMAHFFKMTPMTFDTKEAEGDLDTITIDLNLLVGKVRR